MSGYLIKYRYITNNFIDQNYTSYVDLYFVRKYVEHLNKKYIGEIHHWVINAPPNTPYLDILDYSSYNFENM